MRSGVAELGLEPGETALEKLVEFCALITKWNRSFNLVSRRDVDRLLSRHVLDSLTAARLVVGDRLLDIGSGAGLPGIPLAIVLPDVDFVLCDRSARRMRFLEQAATMLDLANVRCVEADLKTAVDGGERYSTITARAVAPPDVVWGIAEPRMLDGGAGKARVVIFASTRGSTPIKSDPRFRAQVIEVKVPGLQQPHQLLTLERP